MNEANAPVDISKDLIEKYHKEVEDKLVAYEYNRKNYSLPDLISKVDKVEPYIMSDTERDTYLAIREGLQIFRATAKLLADKTELSEKVLKLPPTAKISSYPDLQKTMAFGHNYALYVASKFIVKKLDDVIARNNDQNIQQPELDLSDALKLPSETSDLAAIKFVAAPVYKSLIDHLDEKEKDAAYQHPLQFTMEMKEVFAQYAQMAAQRKDSFGDLNRHIDGYQFRVLDGFLDLHGYDDKSVPVARAKKASSLSFQPISPNEIVGNNAAKRKTSRYIDRLALYNIMKQKNPILKRGGLSWTNLYDGLPGTGKSSMFRMAMTLLQKRAEQVGLPYNIVTIDQSIKDEYYGKTGKILLSKLEVANDPKSLSLVIFDDIDLLTSKRDDAQGADNDVNNIIMQYLDGVFTVRRGNVINFAASNKPTGLDDAMRNRFSDRLLIDGPVTADDFSDMLMLMAGNLIEEGLIKMSVGYTPFATQDRNDGHGHWSGGNVAQYKAANLKKFSGATVYDFGKYMAELKGKNPKITGRSGRAIMDAIKERTADFDVPEEWFENRAIFLDQPYEKQEQMVKELYVPITDQVLFEEATRYYDSEERYATTEADNDIEKGFNAMDRNTKAQIKYLEEQKKLGKHSDLAKINALENEVKKSI